VNAPGKVTLAYTGPITSTARCIDLAGTLCTRLMNRLTATARRQLSVTNAVYSHDGQHVLIPAALACWGNDSSKPGRDAARRGIQSRGAGRWSNLPPGSVPGLNEIGDAGPATR
jgi:hypothetical protein